MHSRDMLFVSLFNSNIKLDDLYDRITNYITENILVNVDKSISELNTEGS